MIPNWKVLKNFNFLPFRFRFLEFHYSKSSETIIFHVSLNLLKIKNTIISSNMIIMRVRNMFPNRSDQNKYFIYPPFLECQFILFHIQLLIIILFHLIGALKNIPTIRKAQTFYFVSRQNMCHPFLKNELWENIGK